MQHRTASINPAVQQAPAPFTIALFRMVSRAMSKACATVCSSNSSTAQASSGHMGLHGTTGIMLTRAPGGGCMCQVTAVIILQFPGNGSSWTSFPKPFPAPTETKLIKVPLLWD